MPRGRFQRQSLGALQTKIKESRILLVGAGGIGCELLKNLVLTGFGEVHIIDLDTIDLSNLNRQFLFRQEHIKKPKALVAKEVAQKFNPNVKLTAYHANIKDAQFNIEWFTSFSLVFNALDNLDARRHVNKMCLAADIPLIESGTTGFNGQVQVIKKGKTACYDCNEKTTPKTFPVCTIRSTPTLPIHCIVWGKSYLLPELFGLSEDDTPELDTSENAQNAEEIENLRQEARALMKIRDSMGSDDFAKKLFEKVFKDDIERLRKMEDMWKLRAPPSALSYDDLLSESSAIPATVSHTDQRIWTKAENFRVFVDSLHRLSTRLLTEQATALKSSLPKPTISFDKDDVDTLDFVAASSNLRSIIFGIEAKSKFDIKQMAGNIIPAIATTNAMVAGLCVMQAFRVLKGEYGRTKMVFLNRGTMSTQSFEPPNPDCTVCGVAMSRVQVDPSRATLGDLVDGVLKLQLGYGEELSVMADVGLVYDPDMDDNLSKKLQELSIGDSSFVIVKDDEEGEGHIPRVDLHLAIEAKTLPEDGKAVVLLGEVDIARRVKKSTIPVTETNGDASRAETVSSGSVKPAETNGVISSTTLSAGKRKRGADEAGLDELAEPGKKGPPIKAGLADEHDTVVLDDAEEGAIEID